MKIAFVWIAAAGCLGPQVSDEIDRGGILPANAAVPSADDDAALDAKIAAHDGVSGVAPRLTAFASGALVHRWDFGTAPTFAAPTFVLVRQTAPDVYERVDHPPIVESVPGDPTYSPFGSLIYVEVTDRYNGEQITSATAVQAAVEQGLLESPVVWKQGLHRPIVAKDVRLDGGAGAIGPMARLYYKGKAVRYFDLGGFALPDGVHVAERPRYVLRRDGGEPLSEPARGVDMDGDGDTVDTNDVLVGTPADADYSPLCRTVDVVVPTGTASIDTSQDEAIADDKDAAQLFDPDPVAGAVIAYTPSSDLRDCPQQRTPGGL